jgi:hypothetical protein
MESPNETQDIRDLIPPEMPIVKSINATYSLAERKFLKEFKYSYIRLTNSPARKQYFRSEMLPPMFEYWRLIGDTPKDSDESAGRIKVLLSYSSS